VRQKLKIFVSLAYAAIFLVFLGVGALPTLAFAPASAVIADGNEVLAGQNKKFFLNWGTHIATGSLNYQ
jgi:hypothetical protein